MDEAPIVELLSGVPMWLWAVIGLIVVGLLVHRIYFVFEEELYDWRDSFPDKVNRRWMSLRDKTHRLAARIMGWMTRLKEG